MNLVEFVSLSCRRCVCDELDSDSGNPYAHVLRIGPLLK